MKIKKPEVSELSYEMLTADGERPIIFMNRYLAFFTIQKLFLCLIKQTLNGYDCARFTQFQLEEPDDVMNNIKGKVEKPFWDLKKS